MKIVSRLVLLTLTLIMLVSVAAYPVPIRAQEVDLSKITIGLSMYTLGAPYFAAQAASVEAAAKKYGMKLISVEAGNDLNKQLSDVEDLIAKGINALILNPKDPLGAVPATKMATEAGIPVFIMDSSIDTNLQGFVLPN